MCFQKEDTVLAGLVRDGLKFLLRAHWSFCLWCAALVSVLKVYSGLSVHRRPETTVPQPHRSLLQWSRPFPLKLSEMLTIWNRCHVTRTILLPLNKACCVREDDMSLTLPGGKGMWCWVNGWRGCYRRLAAMFQSNCPRAAVATTVSYHLWVWEWWVL